MSASRDIFGVSVNPQQIVSIEVRTARWVKVVFYMVLIAGVVENFLILGLERTADEPAWWVTIGATIFCGYGVLFLRDKFVQRVEVRLSNGQTLKGPLEEKGEAHDRKLSMTTMLDSI